MLNLVAQGSGRPLLMIHGLGGHWRTWRTIAPALAAHREVLAIDLPGHGSSPPTADSNTFAGLVNSVEAFITTLGLSGVDIVGSSLGARLVLELARRGRVGAAVALDPGGFWQGWESAFFDTTVGGSVKLLRALKPVLPTLSANPITRTLLLAQFSAHPWRLNADVVAEELTSYADTPNFVALAHDLVTGPAQAGPAAHETGPLVIGWGRHDRVCFPAQAARAQAAFPSARLHWFANSGHLPHWDEPKATVDLILETVGV